MAARRRTTMRSRSGSKLYAVRDETGKFKDIQSYKRAHAADLRRKSKAEIEATLGPIEKRVRKAANDAVKSIKSSVRDAVVAVQKAAKRAVTRVSSSERAGKVAVKRAARTPTRNPAAGKTANKAAKKARRQAGS